MKCVVEFPKLAQSQHKQEKRNADEEQGIARDEHNRRVLFCWQASMTHLKFFALYFDFACRQMNNCVRFLSVQGSVASQFDEWFCATSLWGGCCQLLLCTSYRPCFETWVEFGTLRVCRF